MTQCLCATNGNVSTSIKLFKNNSPYYCAARDLPDPKHHPTNTPHKNYTHKTYTTSQIYPTRNAPHNNTPRKK